MFRFNEFIRFFIGRDVAVAFTLLLVFPALAYFALTAPVWVQDQFLAGTVSELFIWVAAAVILCLESVGVAALYRVMWEHYTTDQRLSYTTTTGR